MKREVERNAGTRKALAYRRASGTLGRRFGMHKKVCRRKSPWNCCRPHGPPEGEGIEWTKHWLGENTVLKEEDGDGMAVDGENMRAKVRKVHSVLSRVRRTPVRIGEATYHTQSGVLGVEHLKPNLYLECGFDYQS